MMRRTAMKRTAFIGKVHHLEFSEELSVSAPVAIKSIAKSRAVLENTAGWSTPAIPKENPIQSEAYMRLVRLLPCAMCGIEGYTQFCHSDEGKGMGIKSDCRLGWPGCGPRPDAQGCHYLVGTSGALARDERRHVERRMGAQTRKKIVSLGLWPKNLPMLKGVES